MTPPVSTASRLLFDMLGGRDFAEMRQPWWKWEKPPQWTVAAFLLYERQARRAVQPVAVARLFEHKRLVSPTCRIDAVGVGGVYTDDKHRNKGYATSLLQYLLRREHTPALILYAKGRTLYQNLGFVNLCGDLWAYSSNVALYPGEWEVQPNERF